MHAALIAPEPVAEHRAASLVADLAELLVDCVAEGFSVGFLAGVLRDEAAAWWRGALARPGTLTWAAFDDHHRAVGCVQLTMAPEPTGQHRAEVNKLLVHRRARGQGVASTLMAVLEREARARGRTLLMLDTETGRPAEAIYRRWGWKPYGVVANHAALPDGRLAPSTFMTKVLRA